MGKSVFLAVIGLLALGACAGPMPVPHEHHFCKNGDNIYQHCQYND